MLPTCSLRAPCGARLGGMATEPKDSAPSDETEAGPVDPFKAALEAKKNRGAYGPGANASGGGSKSGSSAKAGGKREFRRKSG